MGLVRLLKVGKALSEGKEWPGRYRMPRQNAMPSFGNKPPGNGPLLSGKPPPEFIQQELISANGEPASIEPVTPKDPAAPSVDRNHSPAPVPEPKRQGTLAGRILAAMISFGGSVKEIARCALWLVRVPFRRTPKAPVVARQTDLPRLDAVRVVRNDLSDSDFEVVARRVSARRENPFSEKNNPVSQAQRNESATEEQPVVANSE
jgi:hypothetical protein